jgi:hypothetical protein
VGYPLFLVLHAHGVNGVNGFPLDDPWIHLTYARNLHDQHTFAYFPGDPGTQGSTSPLYTFLLAAGFSFTRNEKALSYTLGILFQVLFLITLGAWARRRLGGILWATAAVLLVALDPRIGLFSVSGMETSLFLFLISLAFYARLSGRGALTGAALGLACWTRPDALIMVVIFAAAELVAAPGRTRLPRRYLTAGAAIAAGLIAVYFLFNLVIGHTLLPNTFAAKTAYYRMNSRAAFLGSDIPEAFFTGAWVVLTPLALCAIALTVLRMVRRRGDPMTAEAAWAVGLPLAYLVFLPFSHRFGRYLMPALPAMAILALSALREGSAVILAPRPAPARGGSGPTKPRRPEPAHAGAGAARIGALAVLLAALALQCAAAARWVPIYTEICRYHYIRHERTGRWLAANTPPGAVIASHDVGAIAYYSGRKVVDIVGVVYSDAVRHLNHADYLAYLNDLFARQKVTHLAFLRNWWEVVNVDPLFTADPRPEIMEVFPWIPGRTHLMPREASQLDTRATGALRAGNAPAAITLLEQSLAIDPESSRTLLLLGAAQQITGQTGQAEGSYRRALEFNPGFLDARVALAGLLAGTGRKDEARTLLQEVLRDKPNMAPASDLLRRIDG